MLASLLILLVLVPGAAAQNNEADAARLADVLEVHPGSVLADIGAGPEALLAIPMARRLGPSGRLYATNLDALDELRAAVKTAGLSNVEIVEGHPSRTNLPARCCDGIFIRFVCHHFPDPTAMNASLMQALKPGARMAVIDFLPDGPEATIPAGRATGNQHGVTAETVIKELVQAGFELVMSEKRPRDSFLIVVRRPIAR
jgi:ubiquinone/menaquinone biosynthesis C-methylase UbiE